MPLKKPPSIHVIAGVNGAGKSSIRGGAIIQAGGKYYNPDTIARRILEVDHRLTQAQANSLAWSKGVELLRRAIEKKLDFTFESTLGGTTIAKLLSAAADRGFEIRVWYIGLSSPELHIARVQQRHSQGGHFIPEEDIRRRYVQLIPRLTSLRVFDNSLEADPKEGQAPQPVLVLSMERGKIIGSAELTKTPAWAKPIVVAAINYGQS